ncbi:hypothetical protein A2861_03490 [Candidatus Roizmanbacteria bacterium RIFCSPHIGHO2_01_FULL_38_15]|nr:MAG: hypothetical protein A2861_03490 [Candidatus Roizmanbacteria bacterium RIFCSPHIGHO2_01_FULL_38_15]OGK35639.1 MAG: hypothetical protein A3F59_01705 [Candidatus Roizmanbacteria bacterium RIFCSPHIGHO2_12_FULL_38_13]
MTESKTPRPEQRIGQMIWDKCPDLLFNMAYNMVGQALESPKGPRALDMFMNLKKREVTVLHLRNRVESQTTVIEEYGEDAMINQGGLEEIKNELLKDEEEMERIRSEVEEGTASDTELNESYSDIEVVFVGLLHQITPKGEDVDLRGKAFFQSSLLGLMEFYNEHFHN